MQKNARPGFRVGEQRDIASMVEMKMRNDDPI
jgi:hypothetical protein